MAIDEVFGQPWTRKHDNPTTPVVPSAPRTVFPKSLEELIEFCKNRQSFEKFHAAGSHWALSEAAMSDSVFVESHDPNDVHRALGKTLRDVVSIPGCLSQQFIDALAAQTIPPFDSSTVAENAGLYPIHIETGKRVFQLYAELDFGEDDPQSLAVLLAQQKGNTSYLGSWGFHTLGGAGGQTVFGALTTGTHGGDFRLPPIADAVLAMHLVADGGRHYWIEPKSLTPLQAPLTDTDLLNAHFKQKQFGEPENFEVIRDDDVFNAVLISAGRFGIVYSIVIAAVRQYCMHQERRLTNWQNIKDQIKDPTSLLYTHQDQTKTPPASNHFLQIAVSVTPHENFTKNLAGVTKRWNVPLVVKPGTVEPAGRLERRGKKLAFDQLIQAPRFEFAGNSFPYSPDPANPGLALPPNFLERACSNADFMQGVIQSAITEIKDFINSNGGVIGAILAGTTAVGGGAFLLSLLPALLAILALLAALLAVLNAIGKPRFGQEMNDVRDTLLNRSDPMERAAGLLVWQMIAFEVFSSQQGKADFEAISYAVMDGHDYFDQSCNVNVESIEVFFDATDPMLIAFVDALLNFEIDQEVKLGKAFVGYISLRFTGPTRALIGQQRFPISVAVEVAGLRDVSGVTELIEFAIRLALDSNFKGILHWGQRNESLRSHIQERFGDTFANQTGRLHAWRSALGRITQNGKLDGFSNAFTRRTGLEIVTPIIASLTGSGTVVLLPVTFNWDCGQNPPATEIKLEIVYPSVIQMTYMNRPLVGQWQVPATESGVYTATLFAAIDLGGERREVSQQVSVSIP